MQWPISTGIHIVHVAVTKGRVMNLAFLIRIHQTVSSATPSYKLKKEKREAKRIDSSNPMDYSSLVDPSSVSVIGVVGDSGSTQASSAPQKRNQRRIRCQLNLRSLSNLLQLIVRSQNWIRSGRNASTDLRPFLCQSLSNRPSHQMFELHPHTLHLLQYRPVDTSPVKRTGPDNYAAMQPSPGKLQPDKVSQGQVPAERTGPDAYASQHQSAGKLKSDTHRPKPSTSGRTGPDIALKHQSTGKPASD